MNRRARYHSLLLGIFSLFFGTAVEAASGENLAGAVNRTDWTEAAQAQEEVRQSLQRESESLTGRKEQQKQTPIQEENVWKIQSVALEGDVPGELRWAKARVQSLVGSSLGASGIAAFVDGIQEELLDRGFVTTRVTIPEQNLRSGNLRLVLLTGRIASIRWKDGDGRVSPNLFPTGKGRVLNLRDLEQGIDNLRRLTYEDVTMEIVPAAEAGFSDIVLVRKRVKGQLHGNLSFATYGDRYVGRNTVSFLATMDDAFGLGDRFFASYGTGDRRDVTEKGKDMVSFRWEVPLGRDLLTAYYSGGSEYQAITPYFFLKSNRRTWGISDRHLIRRTQSMKWYLDANLSMISRHSYLESRIYPSADRYELLLLRRHMTQLTLGTSFVQYVPGSVLTGTLSYVQGLRWMMADSFETVEGATNLAHYFMLDTSYSARFSRSPRLRYFGAFHAQYAPKPLLSVSRISIGGMYTVRGFSGDETASADSGYYLRNELAYSLGSGWESYVVLDGGRVSDTTLIGGGIGLRRMTNRLFFDVLVGAPLRAPEGFDRGVVCQSFLSLSF